MASSCSHTSFFSSVTPALGALDVVRRYKEAIHTCRSSPLRAFSTIRYCDWFSESVISTSTAGAISLTRTPASSRVVSNAARACPAAAGSSAATLRHATATSAPLPANAAVLRTSSRAAPAGSSADRAYRGRKNRRDRKSVVEGKRVDLGG